MGDSDKKEKDMKEKHHGEHKQIFSPKKNSPKTTPKTTPPSSECSGSREFTKADFNLKGFVPHQQHSASVVSSTTSTAGIVEPGKSSPSHSSVPPAVVATKGRTKAIDANNKKRAGMEMEKILKRNHPRF